MRREHRDFFSHYPLVTERMAAVAGLADAGDRPVASSPGERGGLGDDRR
jgi:hypothetical protein